MFAWLADLVEELRFERMKRQAMRDLARMDDGTLADVGIERDLIETIARGVVERRLMEGRVAQGGTIRYEGERSLSTGSQPVHCG